MLMVALAFTLMLPIGLAASLFVRTIVQ